MIKKELFTNLKRSMLNIKFLFYSVINNNTNIFGLYITPKLFDLNSFLSKNTLNNTKNNYLIMKK